MGIQSYFIHKKIKSAFSNQKKQESQPELIKIQQVAILVDEASAFNYAHFKMLQKLMKLDDVNFNILTVKSKKSNYNEFKGVVLLTNEINWKGDITSIELPKFTEPSYDLLIDFISKNSALKELIVSQVKAKMKVGFADNNPDFYNIIMKVEPEKVEVFITELTKYLGILKII